jgi:uncharacterized protein YodC (DUF2158 family)
MENLFEIGDTVRLFSGGPLMTVNFYDATTGAVECIWFNALDDKAESTFKAEVLMHDEDSEFDFEELEFDEDEEDDDDDDDDDLIKSNLIINNN